jgi:hypothetical protein
LVTKLTFAAIYRGGKKIDLSFPAKNLFGATGANRPTIKRAARGSGEQSHLSGKKIEAARALPSALRSDALRAYQDVSGAITFDRV